MKNEKAKVKIIPLGGVNEIGKNLTAIEYKNDIVVIDCGLKFPDEDMFGIDLVIPDITYLIKNKEKVSGIFLTHGHEDHIGALPYVLKQLNVPVYGTKLTLGIVETKLKEHGLLSTTELVRVKPRDVIRLNSVSVEFIKTNHSIADSVAIAVHTPLGVVLHTGDFKVDYTPIDGEPMDFARFAELGKKGVLAMMADSTNVEKPGYTKSEKIVGESLIRIFGKTKGRIIIATFASNIHRIQQIIQAASVYGRKVAVSGRSMENIMNVAIELGYIEVDDNTLVSIDQINKYNNDQVVIITTGSQGEPMSALSRMAASEHRKVNIVEGDTIIISATPIPGNEKLVSKVVNQLFKKGAEVIYKSIEEIHVSGHACEQELKLIHSILKPKYFVPVHGEYKHLRKHILIAEEVGLEKEKSFILENGDVLSLSRKSACIAKKVQAGNILVDGSGVGDVGNIVLRDRKNLSRDGIINVIVAIEKESHAIVGGPDIITRGFVYVKESEELINKVKEISVIEVEKCLEIGVIEWYVLKSNVKKAVENYIYEKTKRRPTIIPIIMET